MSSPPPTALEVPAEHERAASAASTLRGDDVVDEKKGDDEGTLDGDVGTDEQSEGDELNDDEYPSGLKMFFIVIALVLSVFLLSLDMTIVATAIPKITDEFKGLDKVGWYGAAFFMTVGAFQSTWGKIYKYFPLKTSFLIALFIFELGSVICGAAPNAEALITGRAIAGLGAAGLGSGAYTIIAFSAPPKKRPAFTGIIGAAYGVASVIGPLLGGVFTDHATWRWCFYVNLPIGGVSALIILIFFQTPRNAVPEEAPLKEKLLQMDPLGIILMMAAIVCYILAIQYGGEAYAWNSSMVIGLLVGFVGIIAAWAVLQWWQGERSMISGRILKNRTVALMSAYAFIFAGSFFLAIYYIPIYFQSVHGTSPTQSGVRNLPFIIAVMIGTVGSGTLVSVIGYYQPFLIGGSALATIGAGCLYMLDVDTSTGKWIGFQIIAGFGWGIGFQIPMIAVQGSVSPKDLASATGILLFFQGLGGAFLVSGGQAAFINQMVIYVKAHAPGVDQATLILSGATEIRHNFPLAQQASVIAGYMHGVNVVFAIAIAATGIATVMSFGTKWNKLTPDKIQGGMA
ncbi:hypothetical protein G7046_g6689 [Stylonectria norvegica]|nr:hypothetical protein G7046_g6689 [Stylonectria norvegica]